MSILFSNFFANTMHLVQFSPYRPLARHGNAANLEDKTKTKILFWELRSILMQTNLIVLSSKLAAFPRTCKGSTEGFHGAETMKQFCMKIDLISQGRENLLFSPSNMAAMTSHENALYPHYSEIRCSNFQLMFLCSSLSSVQ